MTKIDKQSSGFTNVESFIVGLLYPEEEKYAAQMIKESSVRIPVGTIYVTLGRMETRGLVESRYVPRPRTERNGCPRKMFKLTVRGRQVYKIWLDFCNAINHVQVS